MYHQGRKWVSLESDHQLDIQEFSRIFTIYRIGNGPTEKIRQDQNLWLLF